MERMDNLCFVFFRLWWALTSYIVRSGLRCIVGNKVSLKYALICFVLVWLMITFEIEFSVFIVSAFLHIVVFLSFVSMCIPDICVIHHFPNWYSHLSFSRVGDIMDILAVIDPVAFVSYMQCPLWLWRVTFNLGGACAQNTTSVRFCHDTPLCCLKSHCDSAPAVTAYKGSTGFC